MDDSSSGKFSDHRTTFDSKCSKPGLLPLMHVIMNANRTGGLNEDTTAGQKANGAAMFVSGVLNKDSDEPPY